MTKLLLLMFTMAVLGLSACEGYHHPGSPEGCKSGGSKPDKHSGGCDHDTQPHP